MANIEDRVTFDKFNVNGKGRSRKLKWSDSDFKESKKTLLIKNPKRKKIIALIIVIALIIFFLLFLVLRRHTNYITTYIKTLATSKSMFSSGSQYIKFKDGIVRYSRDGISFLKDNGEMIWVDSYNIDSPMISTSKNYISVSGKGENKINLYDERGFVISFDSTRIIEKAVVGDNGNVSVLSKNNGENYFDIYDIKRGTGEIYIKWTRAEDGEAVDFDYSKNGDILAVTFYYIDNKKIKSKVIFYNLNTNYEEENYNSLREIRKIATFSDNKEDKLISKIYFLGNDNAVSFYNGGIDFYKLVYENIDDKKEKIVKTVNICESYIFDDSEVISAISVDGGYASILTKIENSSANNLTKKNNELTSGETLYLYNKNGKNIYKKNVDIDFLKYYIDSGYAIFLKIDGAVIYDLNGIEKYNGKLYDDMIYIKNLGGIILQNIIVGCTNGIKRAILY